MLTSTAATSYLEWGPITLVCVLFVAAIPLIVVAFYVLRLGVRRRALLAKITELDLEPEYLRIYDYDAYRRTGEVATEDDLRHMFRESFSKQFRGDNLFFAYVPPLLLMVLTTAVFVGILVLLWTRRTTDADLLNHAAVFAMAGALVYVYPILVRRYAALSLNPQAVYEIVGSLWLSVFVGVVFTKLATDALKPAAAFVGSLLPIPAFALLKKRFLTDSTPEEKAIDAAKADLMEIVGEDADLHDQLSYIGVRSVSALAFENPLRLFVETDPNLVHCLDLVDRANLFLVAPEAEIRQALNRLAIRSAVDLMSQIYEELPAAAGNGTTEWRFLRPDEQCPPHPVKPLQDIADALKINGAESVRNLMTMMSENPQIAYIQNLWVRMSDSVTAADAFQNQLTRKLGARGTTAT